MADKRFTWTYIAAKWSSPTEIENATRSNQYFQFDGNNNVSPGCYRLEDIRG